MTTSIPISSNTAKEWAERISNVFTQETSIQIDHLPPVSIFDVPNALTSRKPESYTPQLIALGPYHHLRSDLYQMERHKLLAIKSISTPEQLANFQHIVINELKRIDPSTRASYNKFMDYDQDSLAWIMAIDGCFLLNVLRSYSENDSNKALDTTLLDNTIVTRDIMMLENQIPFMHLKKIRKALNLGSNSETKGQDHDLKLLCMMLEFCEAHSPVKFSLEKSGCINVRPMHLLDLMYNVVTIGPTRVPASPITDVPLNEFPLYMDSSSSASSHSSVSSGEGEGEEIQEKLGSFLELAQNMGNKKIQAILKPVQVVSSIPWSAISGLFRKTTLKHNEQNSTDDNDSQIRIPRVSNLFRFGGIKCLPMVGGIIDIKFVKQEGTLFLPVLNLNSSSEVILRNLVAYEAATSKGNLVLARYINLMNGIIDIDLDVKMLRQSGVVKGAMSDEEVADLFNGMKKYYVDNNNTAYSNIDIAIHEVNKYFDKKIVVRFLRQIKRDVYTSWKCLAVFGTVLLFMILSVQSFCDVYECSRFWKAANL